MPRSTSIPVVSVHSPLCDIYSGADGVVHWLHHVQDSARSSCQKILLTFIFLCVRHVSGLDFRWLQDNLPLIKVMVSFALGSRTTLFSIYATKLL
ncbi:lectin, mannose-binding, 1, isoform CRA_b [Rattus norvegicus]|uniref:Lectin, mannose-binding, 1, isoform CRA_b n=1 Tax=Rattus norvegicus TaxID=10116 RepID=A6IXS1_RAT|nr:lectin, mannose-binding, 1, isoform CRA_b [Rattus norvegicus]